MGKHTKSNPMKSRFKELQDFVSQESGQSHNTRGKSSLKKTGTVSTRKDKRKAERKIKKMRKNAFKLGKKLPTLESIETEKKKQDEEERRKLKAEKQKIKNKSKKKKKKLRKQHKAEEEKLALAEANKSEEREIKKCEKLLGLNKRKSKSISQGFKNDGLDFILEAVDPEYLKSMYERGEELDVADTPTPQLDLESDDSDQSDDEEFSGGDSDQSEASEFSGAESDENSSLSEMGQNNDESAVSKPFTENTKLQKSEKNILDSEDSNCEGQSDSGDDNDSHDNIALPNSKLSKKKSVRFEVEENDCSKDRIRAKYETKDSKVGCRPELKTLKHNREVEDESVVSNRKRTKKAEEIHAEFDSDVSQQSEDFGNKRHTKERRTTDCDSGVLSVDRTKSLIKVKTKTNDNECVTLKKAKSDEHKVCLKSSGNTNKTVITEPTDSFTRKTCDDSDDNSDESDCDTSTNIHTLKKKDTRTQQVKTSKKSNMNIKESKNYLEEAMENSVTSDEDSEESGTFPVAAMENSMTSSENSEGEADGDEEESEELVDMDSGSAFSDLSDKEDGDEEESEELVDMESGSASSDLSDKEDAEGSDVESGPEFTEDIYGRLRDQHGNIVEKSSSQKSCSAYVPPGKRLESMSDKKKAEVERLRKQLKGLLNRVSESNMQSIANQIEELFRSHSRAETSEVLTDLIMGACVASYMVPERLVMEQCMLMAILHHNIGSEIGGTFLQSVTKKFWEYYKNPTEGKEIQNVVTLLANLCNFKVVHSLLIFDILKKFIEQFGETDIEVILLILKCVGFTLRKDDPAALKEFIVSVQSKAGSVNTEAFTDRSRVQFMLDVILHIKNNNMRKIPNYDPSHLDHLRKVIRNHIRGGTYGASQLRISLVDLLQASERGKWWLVGSAWAGRQEGIEAKPVETESSQLSSVTGVSQKLLDLAHKQRMNTEVRRNVFCVIMTAEDFVDCFEKLLRLGLKHQQEREIIHVIVELCLQEKTFNPFYAFLTQKFCEYHRRFQMTLQFHLWDRFKELTSLSKLQLSHLSKLLTRLLATGALSLSVFKVLEFAELDKHKMILIKSTLTSLLLDYDDHITQNVFLRIGPLAKLGLLREGLSVFMRHFLCRRKDGEKKGGDLELLKQRVDMAEKCLNTKNQVKM